MGAFKCFLSSFFRCCTKQQSLGDSPAAVTDVVRIDAGAVSKPVTIEEKVKAASLRWRGEDEYTDEEWEEWYKEHPEDDPSQQGECPEEVAEQNWQQEAANQDVPDAGQWASVNGWWSEASEEEEGQRNKEKMQDLVMRAALEGSLSKARLRPVRESTKSIDMSAALDESCESRGTCPVAEEGGASCARTGKTRVRMDSVSSTADVIADFLDGRKQEGLFQSEGQSSTGSGPPNQEPAGPALTLEEAAGTHSRGPITDAEMRLDQAVCDGDSPNWKGALDACANLETLFSPNVRSRGRVCPGDAAATLAPGPSTAWFSECSEEGDVGPTRSMPLPRLALHGQEESSRESSGKPGQFPVTSSSKARKPALRSEAQPLQKSPTSSVAKCETEGQLPRCAGCRFTAPGQMHFVGINAASAPSAKNTMEEVAMTGTERQKLLLLLQQADDRVQSLRGGSSRPAAIEALAKDVPNLLRDLSKAFELHLHTLPRPKGLSTLGGVPAVLVLVVRIVELLDVLVAAESGERGGEASCLAAIAAKGGPFRMPTFFKDCLTSTGLMADLLSCLAGAPKNVLLVGAGASGLAAELAIQSSLGLRLLLAWTPPTGLPTPSEGLLQCQGHEILLTAARSALDELPALRSNGEAAAVRMGDVSLLLDCLRTGLTSPKCAAVSCLWSLAPLCQEVLQFLADLSPMVLSSGEAGAAHEAAAASALLLLAQLADMPPAATSEASAEAVAKALKETVVQHGLSPRLAAALKRLACKTRKGTLGVAGAVDFNLDVRRALGCESVPADCVNTVIRQLRAPVRGAQVQSLGSQQRALKILVDDVEAIVFAVNGPGNPEVRQLRAAMGKQDSSRRGPSQPQDLTEASAGPAVL